MRKKFYFKLLLVIGLTMAFMGTAWSQSVTTAAFSGTVKDNNGQPVYGANVIAKHTPSGTIFGAVTRADGKFNVPGVRVGGPYTLSVEMIGYKKESVENITLALGEDRRFDFKIQEESLQGEEITVVGERNAIINEARTGASKTVSNVEIQTLPTSSRDFNDYTKYTPQFSGNSAGGRHNRYNNIQIDGAVNNDLFGLAASGTPGGQAGTAPISIDAIQEFQIVIAPYDVRYGSFTGAGINAITKSGTNNYTATAYHQYKNQYDVGLSRTGLPVNNFIERASGFSFGGPIMKDKLFFFVNGEINKREDPSEFGITGDGSQFDFTSFPKDSAQKFVDFLLSKYGYGAGGFNQTTVPITGGKFFARLDYNINSNHRLTLRHNYINASQNIMRRVIGTSATSSSTGFRLSNAGYIFDNITNSTVMQLNSTLTKTLYNELLLSRQVIDDHRENPGDRFPNVIIRNQAGTSQVMAGTEQFSQYNSLKQTIFELTDNVTYYMGDHTFIAGTHNEFFGFDNSFLPQWNGRYEYATTGGVSALTRFINSANGTTNMINSYALTFPIDPTTFQYDSTRQPTAKFNVQQYGFYAQDKWTVMPNLNFTAGVRIDIPVITDKPTANDTFAIVYANIGGYRTDKVASGNALFAPRLGFNWDVFNNNQTQVRGGLGIFAGRPAYVWISNQFSNTGADLGTVSLNAAQAASLTFNPDPLHQFVPGNAVATAALGASTINVMSPKFKYPSVFRVDLALDHELPGGLIGTLEFLGSDNINDVMFKDISLAGIQSYYPTGAGSDARPRFGTIGNFNPVTNASGTVTVTRVATGTQTKRYTNVILLDNTKYGYQYNITAQLQKQFEKGLSASVGYNYGRAEDVTSATSSIAFSNWQFNPVKGDPNNPQGGISNYEQRHRLIASVAQTVEIIPKWKTTFSFFFEGRSGRPYSTTYNGDANADGATTNDLIYVPKDINDIVLVRSSATDTRTAQQIWVDLDHYISEDPALDKARGKIIDKNASTEPWRNRLDFKMIQDIPVGNKYGALQFTMDILNVLNMFNKDWGQALEITNQNDSPINFRGLETGTGRPVFSFTPRNPVNFRKGRFGTSNINSRWGILLGARYNF